MDALNYSKKFVYDTVAQIQHGHNPYNYIGQNCGVNWSDIFKLWETRWLTFPKGNDDV